MATTEGCDILKYLQIVTSYWSLYSYHLSYSFQIVHNHRGQGLRVEVWSEYYDWLSHLLREFHEPDYFLLRINHDICHEQVGRRLHSIILFHGLVDVFIAILYHAVLESLREIWREVARTEAVALDDLERWMRLICVLGIAYRYRIHTHVLVLVDLYYDICDHAVLIRGDQS